MTSRQCRFFENESNESCITVVRYRDQLCSKHKNQLIKKYEDATGSERERLSKLVEQQKEFYKKILESRKKNKPICIAFECETKVQKQGMRCKECFKNLQKEADDQKRKTGTVTKQTATMLRKQFKSKPLARPAKKCALESCDVTVTFTGQLCFFHFDELKKTCTEQNRHLLEKQIVFQNKKNEYYERRRKTKCAHEGCEIGVPTSTRYMCCKHRAMLMKQYDKEKEEHGVDTPEAKWLKKKVLEQKAYCKRAKTNSHLRRKRNAEKIKK